MLPAGAWKRGENAPCSSAAHGWQSMPASIRCILIHSRMSCLCARTFAKLSTCLGHHFWGGFSRIRQRTLPPSIPRYFTEFPRRFLWFLYSISAMSLRAEPWCRPTWINVWNSPLSQAETDMGWTYHLHFLSFIFCVPSTILIYIMPS